MFPKRKPNLPAFRHANDCKILARDPGVQILGRRFGVGSGRRSVSAGSSTTTTSASIVVRGSTRSTRRPLGTCLNVSSSARTTARCSRWPSGSSPAWVRATTG